MAEGYQDIPIKYVDFTLYPANYTWSGSANYFYYQYITIPDVTINRIISVCITGIDTGNTYRYFWYTNSDNNKLGVTWTEVSTNPGTLAASKYVKYRIFYV